MPQIAGLHEEGGRRALPLDPCATRAPDQMSLPFSPSPVVNRHRRRWSAARALARHPLPPSSSLAHR